VRWTILAPLTMISAFHIHAASAAPTALDKKIRNEAQKIPGVLTDGMDQVSAIMV